MLFSIFLPAFIAGGVCWYGVQVSQPDFWNDPTIFYGVRAVRWAFLLLGVFPVLLGVWMLLGAAWRGPVLAAAAVFAVLLLVIIIAPQRDYILPEKRMIHFGVNSVMPSGTDIYCNGILLGQSPLKISVGELAAKVPVCTAPPEQRWYNAKQRLFTVFPWDIFTAERYKQWQELASANEEAVAEKAAKFDTESRYWWRFEHGKNQFCVKAKRQTSYSTFENALSYSIDMDSGWVFSPSVPFYARLLIDIAGELGEKDNAAGDNVIGDNVIGEKADWDKHVLKHWTLLGDALWRAAAYRRKAQRMTDADDDFRNIRALPGETLWDSVARLKYNLSEPPTQEESRRLLKIWVESGSFGTASSLGASGVLYHTPHSEEVLIQAAAQQMKDVIGEPLSEQWAEHLNGSGYYQWNSGWAALLYVSEKLSQEDVIKGKNFDGLVRLVAASALGEKTLLRSSDERVIPLFKTLLRSPSAAVFLGSMNGDPSGYVQTIQQYRTIDNPVLESTYRQFIFAALSDPKLRDNSREWLQKTVYEIILERLRLGYGMRQTSDRKSALKEYAAWISSLPLTSERQKALLQYLRYSEQMQVQPLTLANLMQRAAGLDYTMETEKTAEYVNGWFAEHPQGTLTEFFKEHEGGFVLLPRYGRDSRRASSISAYQCLVYALLKIDTPETRKTIRRIWENDQPVVWTMMRKILRLDQQNVVEEITVEIPDFYFDLFSTMDTEGCLHLMYGFTMSASPKAGELLKKWTQSESQKVRESASDCLEQWQTAQQVREKKKELYHDIVTEKIGSDDMLLPQPVWRWNGKEYEASGAL
jgi:hypothetical protein